MAPAWHFWVLDPETLGTTREETQAMARGEVSLDRKLELMTTAKRAFDALRDMDVPSAKEWMSRRRAVN